MNFLQTYGKEIVSLLVPFITFVLNTGLKAKAKLIWGVAHGFNFIVQQPLHDPQGAVVQPNQMVRTRSLRILNWGRESATNVELVFNWKPQFINVWPVRDYSEKPGPDGRHILIFPFLAPKEEIGIETLMINNETPELISVRCKEAVGAHIDMRWIRAVPAWRTRLLLTGVLVGLGTTVYWLIVLIQFLVLRTPTTP